MADPSRVGLVTVTYNSGKVIDDFIRCVLALEHRDFVLFIIDNKSTDDTLERLARFPADPRIVIIPNADNVGVAAGNNQGIALSRAAGCGSILLINNDVEFEPALIGKLLRGLAEHRCDIAVPKIFYHNPKDRLWYAGGHLVPWLAYQEKHVGEGEPDRGQYDEPKPATYSPTCCMMVKAEVFDRIGLMDEKYFVYYDDTDFCFRAMRAGVRMMYIPKVEFYHKTGSLTGGAVSKFSIQYGTRNKAYFVKKNLGILAPLFLLLYQGLLLTRILKRRDWGIYRLQLQSFYRGLRL